MALAVRASLSEECLQVSVGDGVRGVWGVWGMENSLNSTLLFPPPLPASAAML